MAEEQLEYQLLDWKPKLYLQPGKITLVQAELSQHKKTTGWLQTMSTSFNRNW
jgi:hypothetical protein